MPGPAIALILILAFAAFLIFAPQKFRGRGSSFGGFDWFDVTDWFDSSDDRDCDSSDFGDCGGDD